MHSKCEYLSMNAVYLTLILNQQKLFEMLYKKHEYQY